MEEETTFFKALSDSTRIRLAMLLAIKGETCVCRLAQALDESDSKISRHLGILRSAGLVEARREGTWMHYRLTKARNRLEACIQECFQTCFLDHPIVKADLKRLSESLACGPNPGGPPSSGEKGDGAAGENADCGEEAPTTPEPRKNILFLCTGNSCRSQMAEGWTRHLKGDRLEAYSAGVEPHGLDPRAIRVMAEAGVDISASRSKHLEELKDVDFDYVVTVCGRAREACPVFPGKAKAVHVGFDDPPKLAENAESEEEALGQYRRVRDEIRAYVETLPESPERL